MHLGSRTIEIPDDMGHTSLVPSVCSKMDYSRLVNGSINEFYLVSWGHLWGMPSLAHGDERLSFGEGIPKIRDEELRIYGDYSMLALSA